MVTPQDTRVQRHPVRGGFYGLMLGLGVAIYLVILAVTPFRISTMVTVVVVGIVVGALWGAFAPAKKLTDMPPMASSYGSTFTRRETDEPPPTYEQAFPKGATGETVQAEPVDDGAFGAPAPPDGDDGD